MNRLKLATAWLDGCSGCHMSLLDMDMTLVDIASRVDLVYSPLVDAQEFPEGVDVTFVEGAVSSQDDLRKVQKIRDRTRLLVSLGDCAVTGNVPAMRNSMTPQKLLFAVYVEHAQDNRIVPTDGVPPLLPQARPVHEFVKVDAHLPGCPPAPKAIVTLIQDLLAGRKPDANPKVKFG